jgi:hypothetical protein
VSTVPDPQASRRLQETELDNPSDAPPPDDLSGSSIPPAARRALAEAEARRRRAATTTPREIGGRDGPEPVRYGDWEVKGLASDF